MEVKIYFLGIIYFFLLSSCLKDKFLKDFIDFEGFHLGPEGFWNGSDGSGGFTLGNAFFMNDYNDDEQSWSGFSVSNHTDTQLSGYLNQYSCIAGSGADRSQNYAVLYAYTADTIKFSIPQKITNISLCNSTYTYYSILNGDDFTPKFGGIDGTDHDYFRLILQGLNKNGTVTGTATITLASINDLDIPDFIGNTWTDFNLSSLGFVKYLVFSFDSSRKNENGILTPAYVCVDNIKGILLE